ncbi:MAG TPA: hypothetical protein VNO74_09185 [Methylomirabilota bacterium]|nr:hypothetical protein [Methylomirabilota bacterium]
MEQMGKMQVVGTDIPPIQTVFDLKSGARARLVDRSGSMVIIEVEKSRSDWIERSEVKPRICSGDTRNETSLGYRLRSLESSGELVLARRQTWSQRWRDWCCRNRGWCDARRVLVN